MVGAEDSTTKRFGLRIAGIVQGVGFRPHVSRLATELGLGGAVGNDAGGVWCEVEGSLEALGEFTRRLRDEAPPLANVTDVHISDLAPSGQHRFQIAESQSDDGRQRSTMLPADVAPCAACLSEMSDPINRRYKYAFTCCTDCGPRFTVMQDPPYDRERTAMDDFALCEACRHEYQTPGDRRFHAQAICCNVCGPELRVLESGVDAEGSRRDPLVVAAGLLTRGAIVALKGVGGYQLLCRADDDAALRLLRERKRRDEKPFALLVGSVELARRLVSLDGLAVRALTGPEAPIVLAPVLSDAPISAEVAPDTGLLGVMLPASPLHAALADSVGAPLVCTSGNHSQEPIVIDDADAVRSLSPLVDAMLTHDRRIERRADDSVGQVVGGRFQLLRRARGFAPGPVALSADGPTVLGVGAELKNTICLATGRQAAVSVHLGDLENPSTLLAFEAAIADQLWLADEAPDLVAHDLHPEYISTKFAATQELAPTLGVQHHHAHLVSCLIDNNHTGRAIGVTFDGLGWGTDDTAWGGEFLIGDASGYERLAHLGRVALPGGAAAIREPWRMSVAYLVAAYGTELPSVELLERHAGAVDAIVALCATSTATSSIGRLFDAVAALCGLRDVATYEGQAAIGLEQLADAHQAPYPWPLTDAVSIDAAPLICAIVADLEAGVASSVIAGRFHQSIVAMVTGVCERLRSQSGLDVVALSGGVFQNRLLVELLMPLLAAAGFTVLCHSQVPPNDGGISLGQVAIGRAHLRHIAG